MLFVVHAVDFVYIICTCIYMYPLQPFLAQLCPQPARPGVMDAAALLAAVDKVHVNPRARARDVGAVDAADVDSDGYELPELGESSDDEDAHAGVDFDAGVGEAPSGGDTVDLDALISDVNAVQLELLREADAHEDAEGTPAVDAVQLELLREADPQEDAEGSPAAAPREHAEAPRGAEAHLFGGEG